MRSHYFFLTVITLASVFFTFQNCARVNFIGELASTLACSPTPSNLLKLSYAGSSVASESLPFPAHISAQDLSPCDELKISWELVEKASGIPATTDFMEVEGSFPLNSSAPQYDIVLNPVANTQVEPTKQFEIRFFHDGTLVLKKDLDLNDDDDPSLTKLTWVTSAGVAHSSGDIENITESSSIYKIYFKLSQKAWKDLSFNFELQPKSGLVSPSTYFQMVNGTATLNTNSDMVEIDLSTKLSPNNYLSPQDFDLVIRDAEQKIASSQASLKYIDGQLEASAVETGSSYTWSCAGSNGGSTASCSATIPAPVSSSEDPGFGKGLWVPSNTTDRVIADQSGPGVQNLTDYLPGCLNGLLPPTASASGCGGMASYTGTLYGTSTSYTFQYGSGKTLGLRFMSKANAGTSMKYFLMYSGDGGSTGGPVSIWLSQDPTATYATTPAACKSQSTTQPYVITGPGYCPIEANKMYYLFTKVDINCTTCRYRIEENASDFY